MLTTTALACGAEYETYFRCPSPDAKLLATFYREYGGGAAGFQYEKVSVQSADSSETSEILVLSRAYDVRITWVGPRQVLVEYPDSARVDHWQSWFGRFADGRVILGTLPSRGGSFAQDSAGCGRLP